MSAASRERRSRLASRAVQVGFVVGLIALWYLGTTYWGISPLLLPNPVRVWAELKDVIATGEFWPDLKVTLSELAIAFALSSVSGVTLGYLVRDRKSTRLNSSHVKRSRMPSSA